MKRFILTLVILTATLISNAQVRAVGFGLGGSQTVSMQHFVYGYDDDFFQLDLGYHLGVPSSGSLRLTGTYNFMIMSPKWTSEGTWNLYAGPGFQIGSGFTGDKPFNLGLTAQVGLEYIFDFPLQLSVDLRPTFGIQVTSEQYRFDVDGMMGFIPTISARYLF